MDLILGPVTQLRLLGSGPGLQQFGMNLLSLGKHWDWGNHRDVMVLK